VAAKAKGIRVILLTPTADVAARLEDPGDPLNRHAEQVRRLARQQDVALVDSLAAFLKHTGGGGRLADLMSSGNHPSRMGHDLVVEEIQRWFPR
jgi:lysophospholipase L1-like esterase